MIPASCTQQMKGTSCIQILDMQISILIVTFVLPCGVEELRGCDCNNTVLFLFPSNMDINASGQGQDEANLIGVKNQVSSGDEHFTGTADHTGSLVFLLSK